MESIANLVGLAYWQRLYGQRVVLGTDVVPHHLGFVLYMAMTAPKAAAEKKLSKEEIKAANKDAKANVKAILADSKARPAVGRFVKKEAK
jgi:hypothetical protein